MTKYVFITGSPFQHGDVYVTEDGAETDLDLGYYYIYQDGTAAVNGVDMVIPKKQNGLL